MSKGLKILVSLVRFPVTPLQNRELQQCDSLFLYVYKSKHWYNLFREESRGCRYVAWNRINIIIAPCMAE